MMKYICECTTMDADHGTKMRTSSRERRGWGFLNSLRPGNNCYALVTFLALICTSLQTSNLQMTPNFDISMQTLVDFSNVLWFRGNETAPDHFKLLLVEGETAMVGARNYVYNISLRTLAVNHRIVWYSSDIDVTMCRLKAKNEEQCQNYIRTVVRKSDSEFLMCGTNAFKPWCRTYHYDPIQGYTLMTEDTGIAKCPFDPEHNSTSLFVDDNLFSATIADLNARDALIYRQPVRTEQHDSQWLNDPNFVSSFDYDDKIYFFFRETAVEYINCGKAVYSRVGRVCKNDEGGGRALKNTWTSFFKARLNCSIPGEFPFYFDEIQSTSGLGHGNYMPTIHHDNTTDMVYAVFTTPTTSIQGSAVCAFRMSDILESFEGRFKAQSSAHSSWLPVSEMNTPQPHPAMHCANDSHMISDPTLNFIKSHPLMDRAVPAAGGAPLFVHASFDYRFTQITVHWQVLAANNRFYDVIYVGTDKGRVLKMVNVGWQGTIKSVLIEDIEVFDDGRPVLNLEVYQTNIGLPTQEEKLMVVGRDEIKAMSLQRCHLRSSCSGCVGLQDPYCSWVDGECQYSRDGVQDLEDGVHAQCGPTVEVEQAETTTTTAPATCTCLPTDSAVGTVPPGPTTGPGHTFPDSNEIDGEADHTGQVNGDENAIHIIPPQGMAIGSSHDKTYSAAEMAIAIVLTLVLALCIGGTVGYWFSSYRQRQNTLHYIDRKQHDPETKNLNSFHEPRTYNHIDNSSNYTAPPEKQINVVINSLRPGTRKMPNGSAETKVQPQPHKVKKVYL